MSHPDPTPARRAGRHAAPGARLLPRLAAGGAGRGGRHAVRRAVALRSTRFGRLAPAGALLVAASATVVVSVRREGAAGPAASRPDATGRTTTPSPTTTMLTMLPISRSLHLENAVATLPTPAATLTATPTATAASPTASESTAGAAARIATGRHPTRATKTPAHQDAEPAAGATAAATTGATPSEAPAAGPAATTTPSATPGGGLVDGVLGLLLGGGATPGTP